MMYSAGPPREQAQALAPRNENVVYTSPAISRYISTAPKPRPPTVHCSRSIFRRTPARKPIVEPSATIARIVVRETALGLIGSALLLITPGFHSICGPHAHGTEYDPA